MKALSVLQNRQKFLKGEVGGYGYNKDPEYRRITDRNLAEVNEAIYELEELELFKSEHLRLEAELNAILHPNGDGPTAPSFCDLVGYVREDLKPKTCNWIGRIRTGCGRRLSRERGYNYPSFCPHCGGKVVRL